LSENFHPKIQTSGVEQVQQKTLKQKTQDKSPQGEFPERNIPQKKIMSACHRSSHH